MVCCFQAAIRPPGNMLATKSHNQQEVFALLNCRRLPGRLNTTETAVLLGFQEHDIPVLVATKLLNPLGKPAANSPKFFGAAEVLLLATNHEWLGKATRAIAAHWQKKNAKGQPCR